MGAMNTVGLVLHPARDSRPAIDTIIGWAAARQVTVLGLPDEIGRIDCSAVAVSAQELIDRVDLLVSLGGDGTMLRAMRMVQGRSTPVLGVNRGRLGFLAEIDIDELDEALSAINSQRFVIEPRMAITSVTPAGQEITAFNDFALVRIPGDGLAAVSIAVQGHPFVSYAADAVIVATSTGSTAYSFSAGGPIVSPTVEAILVVAAAAHSSFNRAIVLSGDEEVTLRLLASSGRLAVEVDGAVRCHLSPGDELTVTAVRQAARVVRLGHTSFYQRARRKLQVNGSLEVEL